VVELSEELAATPSALEGMPTARTQLQPIRDRYETALPLMLQSTDTSAGDNLRMCEHYRLCSRLLSILNYLPVSERRSLQAS